MPTTSNFGWTTPADTDLVKDGAAAIRTLGNNIDASLVDLKGGTTGQVLAKATNTDLDFTWVAQDDSNAIQNAIVDAKGDLITATAADTPARLAVGTNGQYLQADSTTSTGLKWATVSAGGMTLLSTTSVTTTTTSITGISQNYKSLLIFVKNVYVSGTNNTVNFRYGDANILSGANYFFTGQATFGADSSIYDYTLANSTSVQMNNQSGGNRYSGQNCVIEFPFYAETTTFKQFRFHWTEQQPNNGSIVYQWGFGCYNASNTDKISKFDLIVSTTPTAGGTIEVYGVS